MLPTPFVSKIDRTEGTKKSESMSTVTATEAKQPKKGGNSQGLTKEKGASAAPEAASSKSKAQLRAERRAVQEAQRAAKADGKPPQQQQKQQQKPAGNEGSKADAKKQQSQLQQQKQASDKSEAKKPSDGPPPQLPKQQKQQQETKEPKQKLLETKEPKQKLLETKEAKQQQTKEAKQQQTKEAKQKQPPGEGKRRALAKKKSTGPLLPSFFRHLEAPIDADQLTSSLFDENFADSQIEAAFVQLTLMVAHEQLQGPAARCLGLARALRQLLGGVPTQDLPRLLMHKLDPNMRLLRSAKPLTVMESYLEQSLAGWVQEVNAVDNSDNWLLERIDRFVEEQIDKARSTVRTYLATKINQDDTIMLYKPSSLIFEFLEKNVSKLHGVNIILLDTPPNWEGQAFLRRLLAHPQLSACPVRYALLSAAPSLLSDTSKIVLEAEALTANGNVLAPVGTAYLANVAWSHRIPCLVLCHACQTWDQVLIDSVSYNELGRVSGDSQLCNIQYDLTPGDLITALITERGILPCTGSPVLSH